MKVYHEGVQPIKGNNCGLILLQISFERNNFTDDTSVPIDNTIATTQLSSYPIFFIYCDVEVKDTTAK